MPDEHTAATVPTTPEVTPEPTPEVTPTPALAPEAPPEAATPSLAELLDKADPKFLKSHPKFAGILGGELQRITQERERREQQTLQEKVRVETEEELLRLSDENEEYIKEHYPKAYEGLKSLQKQKADRELDGIKGNTRQELAERVGRAFREIPEWADLTPDDFQALAQAVAGKPDDEVIPIFNRHALDLVAEKRAARKMAAWREKDLAKEVAKERDAIERELAAKQLQESVAPDTVKPKGYPARVNIGKMTDAEFKEYAAQHGLRL